MIQFKAHTSILEAASSTAYRDQHTINAYIINQQHIHQLLTNAVAVISSSKMSPSVSLSSSFLGTNSCTILSWKCNYLIDAHLY